MLEQPPGAFVARREGWRAGSLGGVAEAVGAVGGEDERVGGGAFGEQEGKVGEVGGRVDGGDVGWQRLRMEGKGCDLVSLLRLDMMVVRLLASRWWRKHRRQMIAVTKGECC